MQCDSFIGLWLWEPYTHLLMFNQSGLFLTALIITYRPGNRNTKADALFCLFIRLLRTTLFQITAWLTRLVCSLTKEASWLLRPTPFSYLVTQANQDPVLLSHRYWWDKKDKTRSTLSNHSSCHIAVNFATDLLPLHTRSPSFSTLCRPMGRRFKQRWLPTEYKNFTSMVQHKALT